MYTNVPFKNYPAHSKSEVLNIDICKVRHWPILPKKFNCNIAFYLQQYLISLQADFIIINIYMVLSLLINFDLWWHIVLFLKIISGELISF